MKVSRRDGTSTAKVLAAMCRSSSVLGRVSAKWRPPGLFASDSANAIGTLAVEYHRKHGRAPGKGILSLVESWAENMAGERVEQVERLLGQVLTEKDKLHPDHALDLASSLFNRQRLEKLSDDIRQAAEANQADRAFALIAEKGQRIELGAGAGVDPFTDPSVIESWFSKEKREPLVRYTGDAGKFFGDRLYRGGFVAFMAPEKSMKSTWLLDVAFRGLLNRLNVAFFIIGDSEEDEVGIRLEERVCLWPEQSTNDNGSWPCVVKIPTAIEWDKGMDHAKVEGDEKEFKHSLTLERAKKDSKDFADNVLKSSRSHLKISCHPNCSVGVGDIRSIMQSWALGGWRPDITIIDYADNLAPPPGRMEVRDQINRNWQGMRALSQEMHTLVVTATQARRDSYDAKSIERKHVADDKRKLAHVTAMIGIHATDDERAEGVCRLNYVVLRKGAFSSKRRLHCGMCLPLANPCVVSTFSGRGTE